MNTFLVNEKKKLFFFFKNSTRNLIFLFVCLFEFLFSSLFFWIFCNVDLDKREINGMNEARFYIYRSIIDATIHSTDTQQRLISCSRWISLRVKRRWNMVTDESKRRNERSFEHPYRILECWATEFLVQRFRFFFSFACFISVFPFALSSLLHNIPWIFFHRLQRAVLQCWIACAESAHGPRYKRDTQFAMICVSRISKKEWNEYSKRGN